MLLEHPQTPSCKGWGWWMGHRQLLGCLRCRKTLKWAGAGAPVLLDGIGALCGTPDAKSLFLDNAPVPCTDLRGPARSEGHRPARGALRGVCAGRCAGDALLGGGSSWGSHWGPRGLQWQRRVGGCFDSGD